MIPPLPFSSSDEIYLSRFFRGCLSALSVWLLPFGRWFDAGVKELSDPTRLRNGYTIVLPGIEGKSFLNVSIAQGLRDAGVQTGIEIVDWTTGIFPLFLYHLRGLKRNKAIATSIAKKIVDYQDRYPRRPVHLIGHSGGGAMALFTLEALPRERHVTSVILLAPAVSPRFDLRPALAKTEIGIWNFYSPLDAFFLGIATLLFGNVDGRHCVAAGACGFYYPRTDEDVGEPHVAPLHQQVFRAKMLRQFNFGGHFGCTNRVFVAESIAPLIRANRSRIAG